MKIISPIAIDMGAKNTGVYYAKYEQGSSFEQINKQGQVLVYDKYKYTALLKDRTANRHTRRGYQRKKLAKRLLVLVLGNYFQFPTKQHSQAIGFLLNRRGFTFLDEQYSQEHLARLPNEAWGELSGDVQNILESKEGIIPNIEKFISDEPEKIETIFNAIQETEKYKHIQKLNKDLVYYNYVKKISESCDKHIRNEEIMEGRKDRNKLSKTSKWIVERLIKNNVASLSEIIPDDGYNIDLLKYFKNLDEQQVNELKNQLPDVSTKQVNSKKELKDSVWNFNITQFEFNDKNETRLTELNTKIHLHHFCYAIYKINHEIMSGARHRSKYFEEIKTDLEKFTSNDFLDNKNSPKYLVEFTKALNDNEQLDADKLSKLVCHISNLELKPLRAYFNDKTPIKRNKDYKKDNQSESNFISHTIENGGDTFNLKKLSRLASVWFLKNWRVNADKDNQEKVDSYKELKTAWENHNNKNDVVNFWLKTCPILTIPPYQSMNNRRPPKCQTLLLNSDYLNKHYPDWRKWLELLVPDTGYKEKLQSLESGKGSRLLDDDLIELRQLQFILDTAKKRDKYKLNEIWSIHHKLQQLQDSGDTEEAKSWQSKLDEAKKNSQLLDVLKQSLDFSVKNGFWHFINKYYKTRKKARDGRYFIHQSKKDEWITDDKLLTVCTHKPKRKKHQWTIDLAAVLGIDSEILKQKIGKQSPEDWLKDIKGFKSACEKSSKAQKDYRGELKIKIGSALAQLEKAKKPLKGDAKDLSNIALGCEKLKRKLKGKIGIAILEDKKSKNRDRLIALVFKFAQINNIVFKERSGFSKTCPVCSTDNGFRMQEDDKGIANASRLPAMSIRLIDGLVMRICDAVSRQVATTCWESIKDDLDNGGEVHIPLIFEQNRFEFEPSLAKIKGKTQELTDNRDKQYRKKEQRIKDAAQGICAYFGTPLGNGEEIDHIVPQASKYGTLNDEANLIYVSQLGNQDKGKQSKFLGDLNQGYKNEIFDKTDEEIKEFIYKQLEGKGAKVGVVGNEDYFEFGRYLSFINLTSDQKIAFRHALFLSDDDPLKQKVIRALQNRNRTIVNGTQRYMAQCIADKIYKIALGAGKEKRIEFDYFEYTARADDPKSTYNLRRLYGISKPKKQPLYSHLIDAQLAFLIAAQDHPNDGSMGIKFDKKQTIWQEKVDKTTGEILPSELFNHSTIDEDGFSVVNLNPKSSNQKIIEIETQSNRKRQNLSRIFKRYVFKQKAIGERYKPIVRCKDEWYWGYPMKVKGGVYNCDEYCTKVSKNNDIKKIEKIVSDNKYYELTTDNEQIEIWTIKKIDKKYKQIDKDSHKYFSGLSKAYTEDDKKDIVNILFIIKNCQYYVAKTEVIKAPKILSKFADWDKDKKEWKYKKVKLYPFYKNWIDFDRAWRDIVDNDYAIDDKGEKYDLTDYKVAKKWNDFCKNRFSTPINQTKNRHKSTGKKYTMISLGTAPGTVFRVNRQDRDIYQAVPLDTNIISKDRSNFLIKHSKNLTLVSKTANKDLSKEVNIKKEFELKNDKVKTALFFNDDFLKNEKDNVSAIEVFLNTTSADIKNFPLKTFISFLNKDDEVKGSIKIVSADKWEQQGENLAACKSKIDKTIEITTRTGSIKEIKVNDEKVNFSLPFRQTEIKKLAALNEDA